MNGQISLGALPGADWRASVTQELRNQIIIQIASNSFSDASPVHQNLAVQALQRAEAQAFSTARSREEYTRQLQLTAVDLRQKIQQIVLSSGVAAANANANPAAAVAASIQGTAAMNSAVSMLQGAQFTQQTQTPILVQAQAQPQPQPQPQPQAQTQVQAQGVPQPAAANPTQLDVEKLRSIITQPETHSIEEITLAAQYIQSQSVQSPDNQNLKTIFAKLIASLQQKVQPKHQQQSQAQIQAQVRPQQQISQQLAAGIANMRPAIPVSGAAGFTPLQQMQQLQMQLHSQPQMQAQLTQNQPHVNSQLSAAGQRVAPATSAATPGAGSQALSEDLQQWKQALETVTLPFIFKNQQIQVNMYLARALLTRLESMGETAGVEELRKIFVQLYQNCIQVTGKNISQEALHMLLNSPSKTALSAAQNTTAPAPAPAPAAAAAPAQPAAPLADVRGAPALNSTVSINGVQVTRSISNMSANMLSSPAMSMGMPTSGAGPVLSGTQHASLPVTENALAAPGGAAAANVAATAAANASAAMKNQPSAKNSPSVSSTKSKKKSQSPRTTAKPRKGSSPKATPPGSTTSPPQPPAPVPAPVAGQVGQEIPGVNPTPGETAAARRKQSVSAENAVSTVESVKSTVNPTDVSSLPYKVLNDDQKNAIKNGLPTIERMVSSISSSLPTLYMSTMDKRIVKQIYSMELTIREQARILPQDLYIITPEYLIDSRNVLAYALTTIKNWATSQREAMKHHTGQIAALNDPTMAAKQGHPASQLLGKMPESVADGKADRQTPLTDLHPAAVTTDPSLENFQKAVKHPLDPANLKLPAAKKRASNKLVGSVPAASSSVLQNASAALAAPSHGGQPLLLQQQQQQAQGQSHIGPAVPMLPPGMTQEMFDNLPIETRASILQQQQSILLKQHAPGAKAAVPGQQQQQPSDVQATSSHLWAALQNISTASAQTTEEQNLKRLEQDKWNNPLEYLMGVLDKFTKGSEKAGVEPAPILQQAFWPIARKSMSSGWGIVASDAVL
ncbi:hypothetical protein GGI12_001281 [Dipsacomyces acuminosporus]|nr:hypothetical protein GGI12_001281 [Dipsacomyces acuminosporus]